MTVPQTLAVMYAPFDAPLRLAVALRRRCVAEAQLAGSVVPACALLGLRARALSAARARHRDGGEFSWRGQSGVPVGRSTAVARRGASTLARGPSSSAVAAVAASRAHASADGARLNARAAPRVSGAPKARVRADDRRDALSGPVTSLAWRHLDAPRRERGAAGVRQADADFGSRMLRSAAATRGVRSSVLDAALRQPSVPESRQGAAMRARVVRQDAARREMVADTHGTTRGDSARVRSPSVTMNRLVADEHPFAPVRALVERGARPDGVPPAQHAHDEARLATSEHGLPARVASHALPERRPPRQLATPDIGQLVSAEVQRAIGKQRKPAPVAPRAAPSDGGAESEKVIVDRLVAAIAGRLRALEREDRFRAGRIR